MVYSQSDSTETSWSPFPNSFPTVRGEMQKGSIRELCPRKWHRFMGSWTTAHPCCLPQYQIQANTIPILYFWTHTPDLATGRLQHQAERQKTGGNDRKKYLRFFPAGWGIFSCIPSMEAQASTLCPQCRSQCKKIFSYIWHEKASPLLTWKLFPRFPSRCSERQESLEVPAGAPMDCYTQRDSPMWKSFCTVHQIVV